MADKTSSQGGFMGSIIDPSEKDQKNIGSHRHSNSNYNKTEQKISSRIHGSSKPSSMSSYDTEFTKAGELDSIVAERPRPSASQISIGNSEYSDYTRGSRNPDKSIKELIDKTVANFKKAARERLQNQNSSGSIHSMQPPLQQFLQQVNSTEFSEYSERRQYAEDWLEGLQGSSSNLGANSVENNKNTDRHSEKSYDSRKQGKLMEKSYIKSQADDQASGKSHNAPQESKQGKDNKGVVAKPEVSNNPDQKQRKVDALKEKYRSSKRILGSDGGSSFQSPRATTKSRPNYESSRASSVGSVSSLTAPRLVFSPEDLKSLIVHVIRAYSPIANSAPGTDVRSSGIPRSGRKSSSAKVVPKKSYIPSASSSESEVLSPANQLRPFERPVSPQAGEPHIHRSTLDKEKRSTDLHVRDEAAVIDALLLPAELAEDVASAASPTSEPHDGAYEVESTVPDAPLLKAGAEEAFTAVVAERQASSLSVAETKEAAPDALKPADGDDMSSVPLSEASSSSSGSYEGATALLQRALQATQQASALAESMQQACVPSSGFLLSPAEPPPPPQQGMGVELWLRSVDRSAPGSATECFPPTACQLELQQFYAEAGITEVSRNLFPMATPESQLTGRTVARPLLSHTAVVNNAALSPDKSESDSVNQDPVVYQEEEKFESGFQPGDAKKEKESEVGSSVAAPTGGLSSAGSTVALAIEESLAQLLPEISRLSSSRRRTTESLSYYDTSTLLQRAVNGAESATSLIPHLEAAHEALNKRLRTDLDLPGIGKLEDVPLEQVVYYITERLRLCFGMLDTNGLSAENSENPGAGPSNPGIPDELLSAVASVVFSVIEDVPALSGPVGGASLESRVEALASGSAAYAVEAEAPSDQFDEEEEGPLKPQVAERAIVLEDDEEGPVAVDLLVHEADAEIEIPYGSVYDAPCTEIAEELAGLTLVEPAGDIIDDADELIGEDSGVVAEPPVNECEGPQEAVGEEQAINEIPVVRLISTDSRVYLRVHEESPVALETLASADAPAEAEFAEPIAEGRPVDELVDPRSLGDLSLQEPLAEEASSVVVEAPVDPSTDVATEAPIVKLVVTDSKIYFSVEVEDSVAASSESGVAVAEEPPLAIYTEEAVALEEYFIDEIAAPDSEVSVADVVETPEESIETVAPAEPVDVDFNTEVLLPADVKNAAAAVVAVSVAAALSPKSDLLADDVLDETADVVFTELDISMELNKIADVLNDMHEFFEEESQPLPVDAKADDPHPNDDGDDAGPTPESEVPGPETAGGVEIPPSITTPYRPDGEREGLLPDRSYGLLSACSSCSHFTFAPERYGNAALAAVQSLAAKLGCEMGPLSELELREAEMVEENIEMMRQWAKMQAGMDAEAAVAAADAALRRDIDGAFPMTHDELFANSIVMEEKEVEKAESARKGVRSAEATEEVFKNNDNDFVDDPHGFAGLQSIYNTCEALHERFDVIATEDEPAGETPESQTNIPSLVPDGESGHAPDSAGDNAEDAFEFAPGEGQTLQQCPSEVSMVSAVTYVPAFTAMQRFALGSLLDRQSSILSQRSTSRLSASALAAHNAAAIAPSSPVFAVLRGAALTAGNSTFYSPTLLARDVLLEGGSPADVMRTPPAAIPFHMPSGAGSTPGTPVPRSVSFKQPESVGDEDDEPLEPQRASLAPDSPLPDGGTVMALTFHVSAGDDQAMTISPLLTQPSEDGDGRDGAREEDAFEHLAVTNISALPEATELTEATVQVSDLHALHPEGLASSAVDVAYQVRQAARLLLFYMRWATEGDSMHAPALEVLEPILTRLAHLSDAEHMGPEAAAEASQLMGAAVEALSREPSTYSAFCPPLSPSQCGFALGSTPASPSVLSGGGLFAELAAEVSSREADRAHEGEDTDGLRSQDKVLGGVHAAVKEVVDMVSQQLSQQPSQADVQGIVTGNTTPVPAAAAEQSGVTPAVSDYGESYNASSVVSASVPWELSTRPSSTIQAPLGAAWESLKAISSTRDVAQLQSLVEQSVHELRQTLSASPSTFSSFVEVPLFSAEDQDAEEEVITPGHIVATDHGGRDFSAETPFDAAEEEVSGVEREEDRMVPEPSQPPMFLCRSSYLPVAAGSRRYTSPSYDEAVVATIEGEVSEALVRTAARDAVREMQTQVHEPVWDEEPEEAPEDELSPVAVAETLTLDQGDDDEPEIASAPASPAHEAAPGEFEEVGAGWTYAYEARNVKQHASAEESAAPEVALVMNAESSAAASDATDEDNGTGATEEAIMISAAAEYLEVVPEEEAVTSVAPLADAAALARVFSGRSSSYRSLDNSSAIMPLPENLSPFLSRKAEVRTAPAAAAESAADGLPELPVVTAAEVGGAEHENPETVDEVVDYVSLKPINDALLFFSLTGGATTGAEYKMREASTAEELQAFEDAQEEEEALGHLHLNPKSQDCGLPAPLHDQAVPLTYGGGNPFPVEGDVVVGPVVYDEAGNPRVIPFNVVPHVGESYPDAQLYPRNIEDLAAALDAQVPLAPCAIIESVEDPEAQEGEEQEQEVPANVDEGEIIHGGVPEERPSQLLLQSGDLEAMNPPVDSARGIRPILDPVGIQGLQAIDAALHMLAVPLSSEAPTPVLLQLHQELLEKRQQLEEQLLGPYYAAISPAAFLTSGDLYGEDSRPTSTLLASMDYDLSLEQIGYPLLEDPSYISAFGPPDAEVMNRIEVLLSQAYQLVDQMTNEEAAAQFEAAQFAAEADVAAALAAVSGPFIASAVAFVHDDYNNAPEEVEAAESEPPLGSMASEDADEDATDAVPFSYEGEATPMATDGVEVDEPAVPSTDPVPVDPSTAAAPWALAPSSILSTIVQASEQLGSYEERRVADKLLSAVLDAQSKQILGLPADITGANGSMNRAPSVVSSSAGLQIEALREGGPVSIADDLPALGVSVSAPPAVTSPRSVASAFASGYLSGVGFRASFSHSPSASVHSVSQAVGVMSPFPAPHSSAFSTPVSQRTSRVGTFVDSPVRQSFSSAVSAARSHVTAADDDSSDVITPLNKAAELLEERTHVKEAALPDGQVPLPADERLDRSIEHSAVEIAALQQERSNLLQQSLDHLHALTGIKEAMEQLANEGFLATEDAGSMPSAPKDEAFDNSVTEIGLAEEDSMSRAGVQPHPNPTFDTSAMRPDDLDSVVNLARDIVLRGGVSNMLSQGSPLDANPTFEEAGSGAASAAPIVDAEKQDHGETEKDLIQEEVLNVMSLSDLSSDADLAAAIEAALLSAIPSEGGLSSASSMRSLASSILQKVSSFARGSGAPRRGVPSSRASLASSYVGASTRPNAGGTSGVSKRPPSVVGASATPPKGRAASIVNAPALKPSPSAATSPAIASDASPAFSAVDLLRGGFRSSRASSLFSAIEPGVHLSSAAGAAISAALPLQQNFMNTTSSFGTVDFEEIDRQASNAAALLAAAEKPPASGVVSAPAGQVMASRSNAPSVAGSSTSRASRAVPSQPAKPVWKSGNRSEASSLLVTAVRRLEDEASASRAGSRAGVKQRPITPADFESMSQVSGASSLRSSIAASLYSTARPAGRALAKPSPMSPAARSVANQAGATASPASAQKRIKAPDSPVSISALTTPKRQAIGQAGSTASSVVSHVTPRLGRTPVAATSPRSGTLRSRIAAVDPVSPSSLRLATTPMTPPSASVRHVVAENVRGDPIVQPRISAAPPTPDSSMSIAARSGIEVYLQAEAEAAAVDPEGESALAAEPSCSAMSAAPTELYDALGPSISMVSLFAAQALTAPFGINPPPIAASAALYAAAGLVPSRSFRKGLSAERLELHLDNVVEEEPVAFANPALGTRTGVPAANSGSAAPASLRPSRVGGSVAETVKSALSSENIRNLNGHTDMEDTVSSAILVPVRVVDAPAATTTAAEGLQSSLLTSGAFSETPSTDAVRVMLEGRAFPSSSSEVLAVQPLAPISESAYSSAIGSHRSNI